MKTLTGHIGFKEKTMYYIEIGREECWCFIVLKMWFTPLPKVLT